MENNKTQIEVAIEIVAGVCAKSTGDATYHRELQTALQIIAMKCMPEKFEAATEVATEDA